MEDVADDAEGNDDVERASMDDDTAERIIPVDASIIGDVYTQPSTLIDTHAQSQAPINSHHPSAPIVG
ncbi:MAG: hypothetical protein NTY03_01100, partial [Candidatus Bathyarchaeota archaeon]|nr:hypothetical protein [Candidatus Bathyarchaeota archaeon]